MCTRTCTYVALQNEVDFLHKNENCKLIDAKGAGLPLREGSCTNSDMHLCLTHSCWMLYELCTAKLNSKSVRDPTSRPIISRPVMRTKPLWDDCATCPRVDVPWAKRSVCVEWTLLFRKMCVLWPFYVVCIVLWLWVSHLFLCISPSLVGKWISGARQEGSQPAIIVYQVYTYPPVAALIQYYLST